MTLTIIEARLFTARYRTDRGTPPRSSWTRDSGLEVMTYERTAAGPAGAGGPVDAGATPASQEFTRRIVWTYLSAERLKEE
jgi:hypothetical protein